MMLWEVSLYDLPENDEWLFRYDITAQRNCWWDVFDNVHYSPGYLDCVPYLSAYKVVKRTPRGWRLGMVDGTTKWVSDQWHKRWAWPTRAEALSSLISRREKQIDILSSQLDQAQHELTVARNYLASK